MKELNSAGHQTDIRQCSRQLRCTSDADAAEDARCGGRPRNHPAVVRRWSSVPRFRAEFVPRPYDPGGTSQYCSAGLNRWQTTLSNNCTTQKKL